MLEFQRQHGRGPLISKKIIQLNQKEEAISFLCASGN